MYLVFGVNLGNAASDNNFEHKHCEGPRGFLLCDCFVLAVVILAKFHMYVMVVSGIGIELVFAWVLNFPVLAATYRHWEIVSNYTFLSFFLVFSLFLVIL